MDEVGGGIFVFGFDVVIYVVVVDVIFLFVKVDKYNVIVVLMWEKIDVKYLLFISFDRIVIVIGIGEFCIYEWVYLIVVSCCGKGMKYLCLMLLKLC